MFKAVLVLGALMLTGGISYKAGKSVDIIHSYSTIEANTNKLEVVNLTPTLGLKSKEGKYSIKNNNKIIKLEKANTVVLRGAVSATSVAQVQAEFLKVFRNTPRNVPIYLVLDTPGGSVFAGLDLIGFIKSSGRKVHTITLFAASMGFQIAQNLNTRYIVANGTLMSHRAAGGLKGQFDGEIESRYKMVKRTIDRLDHIASNRLKINVLDYKSLIKDEYWVHGFDSVNENAADEIIGVKCGDSMMGTRVVNVRTFFGTAKITLSECPLIKGPLDVNFGNMSEENALEISEVISTLYTNPKKYVEEYITTGKHFNYIR